MVALVYALTFCRFIWSELLTSESNIDYENVVYQVAVPSPLRGLFDYRPRFTTQKIEPGTRVVVPFGAQTVVGFVMSKTFESTVPLSKLKLIIEILDEEPILPQEILSILKWSSDYYHHPIGQVLSTAVPKKIRGHNHVKPRIKTWESLEFISKQKSTLVKNAPKQRALLELLQKSSMTQYEIKQAGFSTSVVKELEAKELIVETTLSDPLNKPFQPIPQKNPRSMVLNDEQKLAVDSIREREDDFQCFLLQGVTGSGKTEVYMQAMQSHLAKGRQCLVLVPEIGLTPQILNRFTERFECSIRTLHSGLSDSERLESWNMTREGQAGILIGTRSSVFTPFHKLGMIIIDEEHDGSFKQQEGFKYSARDLAIFRAKKENIPIIIGSATPSLESIQNAQLKKYKLLKLVNSASNTPMSSKCVIDISNQRLISGISKPLMAKIEEQLNKDKQVLVFINRRGFAPALSCQNCGWVAECKSCQSQKTVHIRPPSICCHHCGEVSELPAECPSCGSVRLEKLGVGTQKLEAFLEQNFNNVPVFRIDRDSTRKKNQLNEILNQIGSGKKCIMIGTQMIAKGHHFPNITLVAIIDADTGLFSADFRGQEYMAQTITQVSGRAGRARQVGEVVIQTRHAAHATLQTLIKGGYDDFARSILEERKAGEMPPFAKLALIKAKSKSMSTSLDFLVKCGVIVKEINQKYASKVELIGPYPAPLEKQGGKFRAHLLLKSKTVATMQQLLRELVAKLDKMKHKAGLQWYLDVDPGDLT